MTEVVLNVEPCAQPSPARHAGGDCYACALIATLRHLFPDLPAPTFEDTDRWFRGQWAEPTGLMRDAIRSVAADPTEDALAQLRDVAAKLEQQQAQPPTSNDWRGMDRALWRAHEDGYPVEIAYDMAVWPQWEPRQWGYGFQWQDWSYDTAHRLAGWLATGWIALVTVNYAGSGPFDAEGRMHTPDHFALLDGARVAWEPTEHGSAKRAHVHMVCSASGSRWIPAQEFGRRHGGAAWMLVRRHER